MEPEKRKRLLAVAVLILAAPMGFRLWETNAGNLRNFVLSLSGRHSVELRWGASPSAVVGYNIYRATSPDGPFTRLNDDLVAGTNYVDKSVWVGERYYYVVKAVAPNRIESRPSNRASAEIPDSSRN